MRIGIVLFKTFRRLLQIGVTGKKHDIVTDFFMDRCIDGADDRFNAGETVPIAGINTTMNEQFTAFRVKR